MVSLTVRPPTATPTFQGYVDAAVKAAVAKLLGGAGTASDTLKELADQIAAQAASDAATYATKEELSAVGGGFQYVQSTASAQWSISHAFGRRPNVTLYDTAGRLMLADVSSSASLVLVTYANPTAGSAVLT